MEDAKFVSDHDNDKLPEAGHDPDDPLRPEIEEENSTPNPPIGDPDQDMEVTERKEEMPDQNDLEEAGLSDDESELSSVADEVEFDVGDIAIEERAPQLIDDTNIGLIGVHKRKRAEGETEVPKKKKRRADKPRRKKNRGDDDAGAAADPGERKSKRSKKAGRVRGASPDEEPEENLTPEERRRRALERAMDEATKSTSSRRRKKGDIDLEQMADQEIDDMRKRMTEAAQADNEGRERGEPARYKLKLLPEVIALMNRSTLKENIVDPETNLLEAVKFFLEPLSDGSLPAYNIQKELLGALGRLPVHKDSLIASGIGKVIMFYIKSKRPEPGIKRQAERLFTDWTRPILRRTDDYRKKEFQQADYDPTKLPVRNAPSGGNQAAAAARAKALEAPRVFQRARMEAGPTTYTVVPKSNVIYNDQANRRGGAGEDILRKIRNRGGRGGR